MNEISQILVDNCNDCDAEVHPLTLRAGACPACFQARLDYPRGPGVKPWQHGAQWRKNLPAEPARTPRRTLRARLLGRLKTPA